MTTDIDHQALLIAREAVAQVWEGRGFPAFVQAARDGEDDDTLACQSAKLAARLALEQSRKMTDEMANAAYTEINRRSDYRVSLADVCAALEAALEVSGGASGSPKCSQPGRKSRERH